MSEPKIGRLLVASLHQAIAESIPLRLEFYENWLKPLGLLQQGRVIGAASFSAALSFLRREEPRGAIGTKRSAGASNARGMEQAIDSLRLRL